MNKVLSSKEKKQLLQRIETQWGSSEAFKEHSFIQSARGKFYVVTRDLSKALDVGLRINNAGLYVGELKDEELRLSIEGSQLIGPQATQNVIEISDEEAKLWITGNDLEKEGEWTGFVIVKHNKDFLGTGKYKEGRVLNFVPKARRLIEVH